MPITSTIDRWLPYLDRPECRPLGGYFDQANVTASPYTPKGAGNRHLSMTFGIVFGDT